MKKGDILRARLGSDGIHPIIFLADLNADLFIGAMLTSSDKFADNLLMRKAHFCELNERGQPYEFQFKNTHLVQAKFLKKAEWKPFRKAGKLTLEGIAFVDEKISRMEPQLWETYLRKTTSP